MGESRACTVQYWRGFWTHTKYPQQTVASTVTFSIFVGLGFCCCLFLAVFLLWSPCTSLASLIIILIINIFYQPLLSNQIYLNSLRCTVYTTRDKNHIHMMLLLLGLLLFVYQLLLLYFCLFQAVCFVFSVSACMIDSIMHALTEKTEHTAYRFSQITHSDNKTIN